MNANELTPTISNGALVRVRAIVRELDRSGCLLDLACKEVANTLREIDQENKAWTVNNLKRQVRMRDAKF